MIIAGMWVAFFQECQQWSCGQAVVTDIGSSIAGYSTYQVAVAFDARYTRDVYALFGSYDHALQIPPAYQVPTPFGTHVGPVNPAFFAVVRL